MGNLRQMKFVQIKNRSVITLSHIKFLTSVLLVSLTAWSGQVAAFYEWQSEQVAIDARGVVRGFANIYKYPDDNTSSGAAGIARLMLDANMGEQLSFEFNAYQTYIPKTLQTTQGSAGLPSSAERSALFETSFSNSDHVSLAIDRLALRWSNQQIDLTVGRQTINLATTFYFTPNDFFAPFSAQTFYRIYKPGVDALRLEHSLGELSQIALISVLGYSTNGDTGWSNRPDSQRASHLLQWSNAYDNIETTLMAGRVVDKNIIGVALQGELFEWLGIRMEGHHADPRQANMDNYQQFSFGVEHRWENSLELRLELFYNGAGSDDTSRYQAIAATSRAQYLARRYAALGSRYEITPLLTGQVVVISNLDDRSHLLSLNTTYSLSDESELVINATIPAGKKPNKGTIKSEFGTYPTSVNMEFRL